MRPASIRGRVALALGLMVFAASIAFSFILYGYLARLLDDDLDAFVSARSQGVIASLRAYARDFPGKQGLGTPGQAAFEDIARLWKDESAGSALLLSAGVQIYGTTGKRLAATHGFENLIDLDAEALARAKAGKTTFRAVSTAAEVGGSDDFRVLDAPVDLGKGFDAVVQVIVSRTRVEDALSRLQLVLTLLGPAAALVSALGAALVSGRIVAPLGKMSGTLRRISDRRLYERLETGGEAVELDDLARSFNRMMDRVEAAFAEQARFINDAAHQLRTPLTVLRGELGLALKRARSSDEYERILESNLEEVERMIRLVGRMLDMASLDSGRAPFPDEEIDLAGLLRGMALDFEPLALDKGLRFDLSALGHASVRGDPRRLAQAFQSLVENAINYSTGGGAVELASASLGGTVRVEVRDRGIGIPPGEAESIFLRFHRGSTATGQGNGMGLSIARAVMELHGGSLVAATREGGGSVFTAELPCG